MSEIKITSFEILEEYAKGAIVELPSFSDNQPFVCRLKRPSLPEIVTNGTIPNELLQTAYELFEGVASEEEAIEKDKNKSTEQKMRESVAVANVLKVVAKSAMAEPTYKQLEDIGVELTQEQLYAIYLYVNSGVTDLKSFRL